MNQPFQFSLRRVFVAVTWFCLAASSGSWSYQHTHSHPRGIDPDGLGIVLLVTTFAFLGAAIGAIAGRSFLGLGLGIWAGIICMYVAPFLFG